MTAALSLAGASVRRSGRLVLDDVTLEAAPGELLGLLGSNGSGKTTLLRAALGLQPLAAGSARLAGEPVPLMSEARRAALAGYLPQERRVGWNLPAWRLAALGAAHQAPPQARRAALEALDALGVAPLAERGVLDMSGGERARVLIARLLATGAPLLVADEPAAGLDPDAQLLVLERLREKAARGVAVVVSLHDLTLAARTCDRVAVLRQGRLIAVDAPRAALSRSTLREAFGLDGELVESPVGPVVAAGRALV